LEYTKERFDLIIKLYDVSENEKFTLLELAKITGIQYQKLINDKQNLLKDNILIFEGNTEQLINRKGDKVSFISQIFSINKRAIDLTILDEWEETKYLFDRAHLYLNRFLMKL